MVSATSSPIISLGDVLENLHRDELRIAPSAAFLLGPGAAALGGGPTNQQIIDGTKAFYNKNQKLVDTSTLSTRNTAQNKQAVNAMNSYDWKSERLTQSAVATADQTLKGIWTDPIDQVDASKLFTTIGVGISADLQFLVGGAGGLGAMFDFLKRPNEPTKGYGYVTGELGLRIAAELNVQCLVLNLTPSQVNKDVFGLKVSISAGLSLSFQVFWIPPDMTILGYAIGAGVGAGGGVTVFRGHIWNFG